jgi:hypothetical protein
MRKTSAAIQKSSLAVLAFAVALLVAAPAQAQAANPAAQLAPLEQQLSQLVLSSEQFSARVTLTGAPDSGPLSRLRGIGIELSGVVAKSPEQAAITATVAGHSLQVRLLGGVVYVQTPKIAALDGGRPWVAEPVHEAGGNTLGSNVLGLGSEGASGPTFKGLASLIASGQHLRSLGSASIDGQAVSGFSETVKPLSIYNAQVPAKVRQGLKQLHIKPTAKLVVYLAANGVPVRTRLTLALGHARLHVSSDLTAVNVPVAVAAPAVAETITAAELKKLERSLKHK